MTWPSGPFTARILTLLAEKRRAFQASLLEDQQPSHTITSCPAFAMMLLFIRNTLLYWM